MRRCALWNLTHTTSTRLVRSQCTTNTSTSASKIFLIMVIMSKVSSSKISLVTLMVINPKAAIVVLSSAAAIVLRAKMIFNSVLMRMSSSNFRPQTTTRVEMLMSASSCQVISLRPRQLVRLAQCQLSLSQRDMLVSQL